MFIKPKKIVLDGENLKFLGILNREQSISTPFFISNIGINPLKPALSNNFIFASGALISKTQPYHFGYFGGDPSQTVCFLLPETVDTLEKGNKFLKEHPTTIVHELTTPTEEDIPQELLTQLQSLKTYYPQTNIIWNTEVKPYINFDYKLNLPAWLEDKDNKDIIYDKKIETNQKALENQLTSEELDNQSIIDIDYRVTCLELDMEEQ